MKLDSKLFDRIRINPRHPEPEPREQAPQCDWEGCDELGLYRAPKGHRAEGQFHHFCLEHVRHYNTAYNFFAGMNRDEIEEALTQPQASSARPGFGVNDKQSGMKQRRANAPNRRFGDPLNIFARYAWNQSRTKSTPTERVRPLHEPDRRAFETLGFAGIVASDDIKRAYKTLVKIHHPDANGGDRASEDRLRTIIAAYTHLKTKGFVVR